MNAKLSTFLLLILTGFYQVLFVIPAVAQEKKIPRRSLIVVRNDYGSITITGWERETIEAVAMDASGTKKFQVSVSEDSTASNRISVIVKPNINNRQEKIKLEVRVPHYAEVEPISTISDDITVSDVSGAVNVKTGSGGIAVRRAGTVNAQTTSGEISAENIAGDFTAKSGSGNIKVTEAKGFVDITTLNGNIETNRIEGSIKITALNSKMLVRCVEGDVEILDTSSQIKLLNVTGDVDVSTGNGKADFIGALNRASRYRLKALSGAVSMLVPDDASFTAALSSYLGRIETDFKFQPDSKMSGKKNRRGIVRAGDGEARLEMDSFEGRVRLGKIVKSAIEKCE